jgi:rubrerythrin
VTDYFIKRGESVSGPYSPLEVKNGVASGKILAGDGIAQSENGPWHEAKSVGGLEFKDAQKMEGLSEDQVMQLLGEYEYVPEEFPQADEVKQIEESPAPPETPPEDAPVTATQQTAEEDDFRKAVIEESTGLDGGQSSNPNLTSCKDCGGTVSTKAATCPHCGTPNPSNLSGVLVVHRLKRKLFFAAKPSIWLGDNKIGQLKNGETIRVSVPSGEHILNIGVDHIMLSKNERFLSREGRKHSITISADRETIVEFAVDSHGLAKDFSVKTC